MLRAHDGPFARLLHQRAGSNLGDDKRAADRSCAVGATHVSARRTNPWGAAGRKRRLDASAEP